MENMFGEKEKEPTRVFVCYSRKDISKIWPLVESLDMEEGIEVWFAEREIKPGQKHTSLLRDALESSAVFLLCVSKETEASKGPLLAQEREEALQRMKSDPTFRVIPIRIGRGGSVPRDFGEKPLINWGSRWGRARKTAKLARAIRGKEKFGKEE